MGAVQKPRAGNKQNEVGTRQTDRKTEKQTIPAFIKSGAKQCMVFITSACGPRFLSTTWMLCRSPEVGTSKMKSEQAVWCSSFGDSFVVFPSGIA